MNITLRPHTPADTPWLETWLPAVAASVAYDDAIAATTDPARTTRIIERDATTAGILIYRIRKPTHDAVIELIATPASEARRGAGMAAAAIVEDELRTAGATRAYAPAPELHGIAMYFWIRLGYRPLMRPEWPCEREGVAWLARDLT